MKKTELAKLELIKSIYIKKLAQIEKEIEKEMNRFDEVRRI